MKLEQDNGYEHDKVKVYFDAFQLESKSASLRFSLAQLMQGQYVGLNNPSIIIINDNTTYKPCTTRTL